MKEMAIKKLSEELRGFKGNRCAAIMKDDVNKTLRCFCEQDREFAQAVVQGGSFSECMEEVAKNCNSGISDLEAFRRSVNFYFPGADIWSWMMVDACASVDHDSERMMEAMLRWIRSQCEKNNVSWDKLVSKVDCRSNTSDAQDTVFGLDLFKVLEG